MNSYKVFGNKLKNVFFVMMLICADFSYGMRSHSARPISSTYAPVSFPRIQRGFDTAKHKAEERKKMEKQALQLKKEEAYAEQQRRRKEEQLNGKK